MTERVSRRVFGAHPGDALAYHRSNSSPIVVSNARRRGYSTCPTSSSNSASASVREPRTVRVT